jgi:hypothetical protein
MAKPWAQIRVRERSGVHIFVLNQGGTAEDKLFRPEIFRMIGLFILPNFLRGNEYVKRTHCCKNWKQFINQSKR